MSFEEIFKELDSQPSFNAKLNAIRNRAEAAAISAGYVAEEEKDTFRHIYSSTVLAKYYGQWEARGLGVGNELNGEKRNIERQIDGRSYDPTAKVIEDSLKDLYNNEFGFEISSTAQNEADVIRETSRAIDSKEAITEPGVIGNFLLGIKNFFSSFGLENTGQGRLETNAPMSLVEGDGMGTVGQGGFDPSFLIEAFGGKKHSSRNNSTHQIVLTSATALARELFKSKRRTLENDMIEIFTGKDSGTIGDMFTRGGTPPFIGGSSQAGFSDVMLGVMERMVGAAFNRTRTRTSTSESERSREASRSWNPSRSQQQAMLAQWAQQGTRNL